MKTSAKGFSLLEIIIAVAIFAVISTISYASLISYYQQSERVEQAHLRLERIQKLFSLLEQDIRYIIARPVQYNNSTFAALEIYKNRPVFSGEVMQFTTSRPIALNNTAQTNFRVSWRLEGESVFRYSWSELDLNDQTLSDKQPDLQHIQRIMDDVSAIEVSVKFEQGDEQIDTYNEKAFSNEFDQDLYRLPKLLKVLVRTTAGVEYFRILEIGSATVEEV